MWVRLVHYFLLVVRIRVKLTPCCECFDPEGYYGQRGKNSEKLYSVCRCSNPDQYFYYWDSVHPTMAAWEAVMKQLKKPKLQFLMHN
jgi:hypothetical protein